MMSRWLYIGLSVATMVGLSGCGGSGGDNPTDHPSVATIEQVWQLDDTTARLAVKIVDLDGIVSATITIDSQTIPLAIIADTKTVDINQTISSLSADTNFTATLEIVGVDGVDGESADPISVETLVQTNKTPEADNTAPTLTSVDVSWNTVDFDEVYQWKEYYSISKNVDHEVTFKANWSDDDGDTLKIVVNWTEYEWDSYTETLNLVKDESKEFKIKEYDWKDYSNEKIIVIYWA